MLKTVKNKNGEVWVNIHANKKKLVVKSIYEMIDKEIKDRSETRNPTDEQIVNIKM